MVPARDARAPEASPEAAPPPSAWRVVLPEGVCRELDAGFGARSLALRCPPQTLDAYPPVRFYWVDPSTLESHGFTETDHWLHQFREGGVEFQGKDAATARTEDGRRVAPSALGPLVRGGIGWDAWSSAQRRIAAIPTLLRLRGPISESWSGDGAWLYRAYVIGKPDIADELIDVTRGRRIWPTTFKERQLESLVTPTYAYARFASRGLRVLVCDGSTTWILEHQSPPRVVKQLEAHRETCEIDPTGVTVFGANDVEARLVTLPDAAPPYHGEPRAPRESRSGGILFQDGTAKTVDACAKGPAAFSPSGARVACTRGSTVAVVDSATAAVVFRDEDSTPGGRLGWVDETLLAVYRGPRLHLVRPDSKETLDLVVTESGVVVVDSTGHADGAIATLRLRDASGAERPFDPSMRRPGLLAEFLRRPAP